MKLRNKKTGEIITLKDEGELALLKLIENSLPNGLSLWEKVREPLIKDEKIRKAVRAWAEANKEKTCLCYNADENSLTDIYRNEIAFNSMLNLEDCKEYSIAELCGEEEAPEPLEPTFCDLDERIKDKEEE